MVIDDDEGMSQIEISMVVELGMVKPHEPPESPLPELSQPQPRATRLDPSRLSLGSPS
jgi:hypothetical protein